jgi:ribosome-associated translation inhibitor RaiA
MHSTLKPVFSPAPTVTATFDWKMRTANERASGPFLELQQAQARVPDERMNIELPHIARTYGRQTRAYAEYRVFSSLARFSDVVRDVTVSLASCDTDDEVRCSVIVTLRTGERVRVAGRGHHVYEAINRAAHQIAPALSRPSRAFTDDHPCP